MLCRLEPGESVFSTLTCSGTALAAGGVRPQQPTATHLTVMLVLALAARCVKSVIVSVRSHTYGSVKPVVSMSASPSLPAVSCNDMISG